MHYLLSDFWSFITFALSLVIAITVHEFAHAFAADKLGDPTPRLQGRLTLNPLAHLDPLGTVLMFIARFGWGKPVQFDPFNLRNPKRDAAIISFAGPFTNILTAVIASIVFRVISEFQMIQTNGTLYIQAFLISLISINVVLACFNLIPIHPLDGFKIVGGFLTPKQAKDWYSLERYGMIFLVFLIFPFFGPAPISLILTPMVNFLIHLLLPQYSGIV